MIAYCRPWQLPMYRWGAFNKACLSTRGASASNALRAKEELVRILFGSPSVDHEREETHHQLLDHSVYSYDDLRNAYLKKLQTLHPDKHDGDRDFSNARDREVQKTCFLAIVDAWNRYEALAKLMKRVSKGDCMKSNFTMFGVGCSFADSDSEKELRSEIMDQACRGFFPAGELGTGKVDMMPAHPPQTIVHQERSRVVDDSWFLSNDEDNNCVGDSMDSKFHKKHTKRKSLVEFIPHYRK